MKRAIWTPLVAGVGMFAGTVAADAQTSEGGPETPQLDTLVVSGSPVARALRESPGDISVLSGEEKRRRQGASLGGSLDHLPGVESIGTGSQVGKPVIRGFSGDRVRVLTDGIGLDHQQFGVRHGPNIEPFLADQIEVVRGASSILYGSGALGGAVNVRPPKPPAAPDGETRARGQSMLEYQSGYDQITGAAKAEVAYGRFGLAAGFVGRDSGGLETPSRETALESGDPNDPLVTGDVPFTDFRQFNGDLNLGYMTDLGQVVVRYEAYRDQHNFVVPDPPPPNGNPLQPGGIGQTLENDTAQLKADLDVAPWLTVKPSVTFSSNFRLSNPGPPEPQPRSELPDAAVIDVRRNNWTGRLEGEHGPAFGLFEGRVGVEAVRVDQESRGSTALTPGGDITNLAAFAFEEWRRDRLTLTAGVRVDYRNVEGDPDKTADPDGLPDDPDLFENDYLTPTGSVGALYQVTDRFSVATNVSRGFRAPGLFDLFVDGVHGGVGAVQQGDPTLDPETSWNADASLRWHGEGLSAQITGYVNEIDDFIFLAGTGTTDAGSGLPVFQVSQQDARLFGVDLSVDARPQPWLSLHGTLGYVDGELSDGTQVPLLPPLKLRGEATIEPGDLGVLQAPYMTVGVRYADSQQSAGLIEPFGQFDEPPPPFGTASTDSYALLDLSVGGQIGRTGTTIDLAVNNVLDTAHRDFLDTYKNVTLGAGRNVVLRLTQAF